MKEIKIKRLSLENFKCHDSLTLEFQGRSAAVYGDNATGKTSIYDALTWLLFGRDSRGNGEKNIEIKPLAPSGEVSDHMAITSVEAVFNVNDGDISLRRTYQEIWSTKRGSAEATYDGNTSEYFVDGVPCKKYAFTAKVEELVSEELFYMLTSVSYFADSMPWQQRREVLFRIAGTLSDKEILETKAEFAPLIEGMGHLSIDDYKKKLLAEKKGYVGTRDEIPARINECQKTVEDLSGIDFEEAKKNVLSLEAQKDKLSAELLSIDHSTAVQSKELEIKKLQSEVDELERKNRLYRAGQSDNGKEEQEVRSKLQDAKYRLASNKAQLKTYTTDLCNTDRYISDAREDWMSVNSETCGAGICPTCGQALPPEQLASIKAEFEDKKRKKLSVIEERANGYKAHESEVEKHIKEIEKAISEDEQNVSLLEGELVRVSTEKKEITDMEGYRDTKESLELVLKDLQSQLCDLRADGHSASVEIRNRLYDINTKLSEAHATVGKESALEYAQKRIEELQAEAKAASEKLQTVEKLLWLMEEFTRYKTTFVEENINGKFRIARFRLFREQANGGIEERCDVVYDGVPYISVNNGTKINLGIDIINTLSRAYGVNVPLFVDNAESVTALEGKDGQIVRLVVSEKDKELRVEYEG